MAEPEQVWYGFCTFWTDDWGQLSATPSPEGAAIKSGLPCCPDCGSVGYQVDKGDWEEGVGKLEAAEPGYAKFIAGVKELCHGKGISLGSLWEEHKKEMAR